VKMSTRNIPGGKGGRWANPLGHTGRITGLLYLLPV
jgi:hypothetical protein